MTSPRVELFFESDSRNPMSLFARRKCVEVWLSEALAQVLNPTSEGPRSSTRVAAAHVRGANGDREGGTSKALFYVVA